ncbi:MAG TPA: S9 family peptidase [Candidatus Cloacimonetes bacterium]|nr:S9 family peptidase [Candidatus Cloacimonadota bacterium]HEX38207.1 S9 family peptidase [Candidatus Cloacimonadota bacterium]
MKYFILVVIAVSAISCSSSISKNEISVETVEPPIAEKIPHETAIHDTILVDHYHWMKDKSRTNPKIIEHIEDENNYTDKVLAHTAHLQQQLYDEMVSRIPESDISVPVRIDTFFYYWKDIEGQEYSVYCRKHVGSIEEHVILDINALAEGYEYYDVQELELSPNHQYMAFSYDTTGAENYTMTIMDLTTGEYFSDSAYPVDDIEWSLDNRVLYYTTTDETGRSNKVFIHKLGETVDRDKLIYEDSDGSYYVWLYRTKDDKWMLINSGSKTSSECRIVPADDPYSEPVLVKERVQDVRYYLYSHLDSFFVITNIDGAENFKVMTCPFKDIQCSSWEEYIPARDSTQITIDIFRNYLVIYELFAGMEKIRIRDLKNNNDYYVPFQDELYSLSRASNPMFDSDTLRFSYQSFITPQTVYDLNMRDHTMVMCKQQKVNGSYEPQDFKQERVFARASDGTAIPISMVYKKETFSRDGSNPLLLEGYGAYGDLYEPYFSPSRLSLLNRGFVYAIAHVRGGGEYGRQWHEQGRLLHKRTTFTDFISCTEYLIDNGYTNPDKLVIQGGSAGGLLVGAVLNMRPELFEIAIADVPFVDVINTMLDPSLSATISEYEEWGNPEEKEYFDYIMSYCPYYTIKPQRYPHILALGGFYDPRVNYWEPMKWIAKLREKKLDSNLALLKIQFSGHMGASGRYSYLHEVALKYAFMFDILGIDF